jgi:hypothetical protein
MEERGRGTQVVRERSAKPLCVGSIPTRASIFYLELLSMRGPSLNRRHPGSTQIPGWHVFLVLETEHGGTIGQESIRRCLPRRQRTLAKKRLNRRQGRCRLGKAMVDRVLLDQVLRTDAAPSALPVQRQHPCSLDGRRTRALVIVPKPEWRGRVRPVACGELPVRSWPRFSPATSKGIMAADSTVLDKTRGCSDFGTTVLGNLGAPLTFRPALFHHLRQPPSACERESPPPRSSGPPARATAPAWFPIDLFKQGDGFIEPRAFASQLVKNFAKVQGRRSFECSPVARQLNTNRRVFKRNCVGASNLLVRTTHTIV